MIDTAFDREYTRILELLTDATSALCKEGASREALRACVEEVLKKELGTTEVSCEVSQMNNVLHVKTSVGHPYIHLTFERTEDGV